MVMALSPARLMKPSAAVAAGGVGAVGAALYCAPRRQGKGLVVGASVGLLCSSLPSPLPPRDAFHSRRPTLSLRCNSVPDQSIAFRTRHTPALEAREATRTCNQREVSGAGKDR